MSVVELYGREGCCLCVDAREQLLQLARELDFDIVEHDIDGDEGLQRRYFERIPVVVVDGVELCDFQVDEPLLRARVRRRDDHLESAG